MVRFLRKNKKTGAAGDQKQSATGRETAPEKVDSESGGSVVYTEEELEGIGFTGSLAENMAVIKKIIGMNADLIIRELTLGRSQPVKAALLYIDNLIDPLLLDQEIIRPLALDAYSSGLRTGVEIIEQIHAGNLITRGQIKKIPQLKGLFSGLLIGEAELIIDGVTTALSISTKGYQFRAVSDPDAEPVVRGPRDAFVETLSVNLGLIRRRIQSPNLVMELIYIGKVSRTKIVLCYIKGICPPELVNEMRKRLQKIDIDGVLESGYIEEFIQDHPYSPFPQLANTERPDRASAALLEGRLVVITDNTPVTLIAPGEFFSLLQAAEDYYNRFYTSTLVRIVRYFALMVALVLPASYIAITTYHQEMIPTQLLISIIAARTGVPFPALLEALIMEIAFELLREAGVRLPRPVGQAISIVGALVIGQAAVEASLVSPLMVIVVALTGIASFVIPQYNIALTIRNLRFPLMLLAAFLGLFGVMTGLLVILLHMSSLRSFGVPYLAPLTPFHPGDLKDTLFRAPWWALTRRPSQITANTRRMQPGQMPHPPKKRGEQ